MLIAAFEATVVAIAMLVVYRLLSGAIQTRGLLTAHGGERIDPERVQLVAIWLGGVGWYVIQALGTLGEAHPALPDLPPLLTEAMVGSQFLYLTGKLVRH